MTMLCSLIIAIVLQGRKGNDMMLPSLIPRLLLMAILVLTMMTWVEPIESAFLNCIDCYGCLWKGIHLLRQKKKCWRILSIANAPLLDGNSNKQYSTSKSTSNTALSGNIGDTRYKGSCFIFKRRRDILLASSERTPWDTDDGIWSFDKRPQDTTIRGIWSFVFDEKVLA